MRVVDGGTVEIIPAAYGIMEVRLIGGGIPQGKAPHAGVQPY
jgi:hypothetical protein